MVTFRQEVDADFFTLSPSHRSQGSLTDSNWLNHPICQEGHKLAVSILCREMLSLIGFHCLLLPIVFEELREKQSSYITATCDFLVVDKMLSGKEIKQEFPQIEQTTRADWKVMRFPLFISRKLMWQRYARSCASPVWFCCWIPVAFIVRSQGVEEVRTFHHGVWGRRIYEHTSEVCHWIFYKLGVINKLWKCYSSMWWWNN